MNKIDRLADDLSNLGDDMSHMSRRQQGQLSEAIMKEIMSAELKDINEMFKSMGIQTPTLDRMSRALDESAMTEALNAGLSPVAMMDLYKFGEDLRH